ncbi:hypothetical protein [Luteimonas aquatica]|uniref:hypothetical protein n=1 Tax=Luteimonas aquatica TaxID=450364 RepID=UPI001F59B38F|nr:hypothetical protein [Luteimonas aquatica]
MSLSGVPSPWWLAACAGIACLGTWAALRYARWRNLLDHPGERRSHAVATPRGGGIGIVFALLFAQALFAWQLPESRGFLGPVSAGLALVAGIGWLDDHRSLSPWPRLAVHGVAAALLAWAVWGVSGDLPAACLAFALALGLVNVWNFMDGIDGIAALQAVVVAMAYAWLTGDALAQWLALALAAGAAGFLPFNLPLGGQGKARIFLGDVGSGAIGYALAAPMALMLVRDPRPATWVLMLLPPSAFLLDAALTLLSRMLRGERWWTPHVEHAYQHWARRAGRHRTVTLAYAAWAAAGGVLVSVICETGFAFIIAASCAWYLGGGIAWRRLRRR